MYYLLLIVRYLWVLPASLFGIVLGAIAVCLGAQARFGGGVLEVGGGRFLGRVLSDSFAAVAIGHTILGVNAEQLERLRSHELVHVRQYEAWGVLFFVLYPLSSLIAFIKGRHPYFDNIFEKEAYGELC